MIPEGATVELLDGVPDDTRMVDVLWEVAR